jgi:hypothetical protein
MEKVCCICLENETMIDYECVCCNEGKICSECMIKKIFIDDDMEYVKCPICRTHNWKYLYSIFICDLDSFFEGMLGLKWKPVYDICFKNCDDKYN